MRQALLPYVTTGIAIVGASLIAVTPVAPPAPNVQQRALKLVDYTEYDASQLTSATETNWAGLESILSSSNWTTDPDISQGLSTLFSDLSTGTSNAVTNPLSELTEGLLGLVSGDYGFNAASTAFTAVTDNIESALSSGDYSTALTDFENEGTTVLYAFLNGYNPGTDGVGGLISPEFGLLTNTADGAATGQIDALAQVSNTIADEVANLGGADLTTGTLPLVTGNLDLSVSLSQILSDLGLGSASSLTINGLISDLGLSPTGDLIPSLTVGDVLGDLNLSDTSGISLTQILEDLNVITPGNTDPTISVDSILGDLGINTSTTSLSVDSILHTLGVDTTSPLSVSTILGDLGINTTSPIQLDTILSAIGIDPSGTLPGLSVSIPVQTLLNDVGLGNLSGSISFGSCPLCVSVSDQTVLNDLLSALHISTSGDVTVGLPSISISSILSDLNLNSSFSFNTILSDIGLGGTFSIDQILSGLGLNGSLSLNQALSDLGINGSYSLDSLLGALGINANSGLDLGQILGFLGLTDSSAIPLPSVSIDGLLGDLGIDPNENLLTLLGIPNALSLNPTIDLDGGPVATYIDDLAKDLLALVGSSSTLSSDLPSLLGTDPTFNLEPVLSSLLSDLGVPATIDGTLSVDLTNVLAELLPSVF
jgi:hypothetical protein